MPLSVVGVIGDVGVDLVVGVNVVAVFRCVAAAFDVVTAVVPAAVIAATNINILVVCTSSSP